MERLKLTWNSVKLTKRIVRFKLNNGKRGFNGSFNIPESCDFQSQS